MPKHTLPAADLGLPNELSRADVERTIAHLIDLLDVADGDPDAEDDDCDDEPEEDDDETPEPSLASRDAVLDQTGWASGAADDRERDDSDLEPDLGSPDGQMDQRLAWADTPRDDRERDDSELEPNGDEHDADGDERDGPEDSGLGDADGALEQLGLSFFSPRAPDLRLAPTDRAAVVAASAALDALVRRRKGVPGAEPAPGGNLRLLDEWLVGAPRAR